jgi:hypothetical protein
VLELALKLSARPGKPFIPEEYPLMVYRISVTLKMSARDGNTFP